MKSRETLMLALVSAALSLGLGCSQDDTPRRTLGGGTTETASVPAPADEGEPTLPGGQPAAPAPAAQEQAYAPLAAPAPARGPVEYTTGNDRLLGDLNGVTATLQNQDYDAAVNTLAAVSLVRMTPEQQRAYHQQLYQAQELLLQRANSDPRARQAYENLGKKVTGR
jgi:hypothetical protein